MRYLELSRCRAFCAVPKPDFVLPASLIVFVLFITNAIASVDAFLRLTFIESPSLCYVPITRLTLRDGLLRSGNKLVPNLLPPDIYSGPYTTLYSLPGTEIVWLTFG